MYDYKYMYLCRKLSCKRVEAIPLCVYFDGSDSEKRMAVNEVDTATVNNNGNLSGSNFVRNGYMHS